MKVGDYVRTKDGIIGRIEAKNYLGYNDWLIDTLYYNDDEIINDWTCGIKEYNILKSSPNIIDLVQVGDVITTNNLCGEITKIDGDKIYTTCYDGEYCSASDIKSIVTKEQFESMEYRIGE